MVKGKHGAISGRAELHTAQASLTALQGVLEQERLAHRAELAQMRSDLAKVQSMLVKDVKTLADDRVQEVEAHRAAERRADAEARDVAALTISKICTRWGVRLPLKAWTEIATALSVSPGLFLSTTGGSSREVRRTNQRKANLLAAAEANPRVAPRLEEARRKGTNPR